MSEVQEQETENATFRVSVTALAGGRGVFGVLWAHGRL